MDQMDILEPVIRFFQQQRQLGQDSVYLSKPLGKASSKHERLRQIKEQCQNCRSCKLVESRTQIVFGDGDCNARIVVVGEAPGRDEDLEGIPFVGRAGQLLTRMLEGGMGVPRSNVYICNVCKCRPPENRTPAVEEMLACEPFLKQQLAIVRPEVIIAMGNVAVTSLLRTKTGITRLRGKFVDYEGIPLMPTYHPAYLLRNPAMKSESWQDLQQVMKLLGLPVPDRNRG